MAARNREIREAARAQSPANAPAPVSVPDSSLKKCVSFSFQGTQVNCVNQLGFGTYGVVYSASVGPAPGLPVVAVKVPRSSKLGEGPSPCSIYDIAAEHSFLHKHRHPFILSTFGLCTGTTVALVLELGVGPLSHHLASEKLGAEANGMYPRKLHRRWAWAHQLATALGFLHGQQILHGDLKPANCILFEASADLIVKLADFSLARSLENGAAVAGKSLYSAPYRPAELLSAHVQKAGFNKRMKSSMQGGTHPGLNLVRSVSGSYLCWG